MFTFILSTENYGFVKEKASNTLFFFQIFHNI